MTSEGHWAIDLLGFDNDHDDDDDPPEDDQEEPSEFVAMSATDQAHDTNLTTDNHAPCPSCNSPIDITSGMGTACTTCDEAFEDVDDDLEDKGLVLDSADIDIEAFMSDIKPKKFTHNKAKKIEA